MKKFNVFLSGIVMGRSGIRLVHANNEKEAKKIASERYPSCEITKVERIR